MMQELHDLPAREVVRGIREDLEGFVGVGLFSDDARLSREEFFMDEPTSKREILDLIHVE